MGEMSGRTSKYRSYQARASLLRQSRRLRRVRFFGSIFGDTRRVRKGSYDEKQYRRYRMVRVLYFVSLVGFWVVCFGVFFYSPLVVVSKVDVRGVEDIPADDVLELVYSVIDGTNIMRVSRANILLFPKHELENRFREEFPKILSAEVTRVFPDTVRITIKERQALFTWCAPNGCFVLDENGVAYESEEAVSYVDPSQIVRLESIEGRNVSLSEHVVSRPIMETLSAVYRAFDTGRILPDVGISGDYRVHRDIVNEASFTTTEGWMVKISTELPSEETLRDMLTFFTHQFTEPSERQKLEYIDVRLKNKVFYRLKEEYRQETVGSQSTELEDAEHETSPDKETESTK